MTKPEWALDIKEGDRFECIDAKKKRPNLTVKMVDWDGGEQGAVVVYKNDDNKKAYQMRIARLYEFYKKMEEK